MVIKLDKIFDSIRSNNIFKDKSVLQSNYTPQDIPHRDKEIEQIATILAPFLRKERSSNLFIYGNPGTGKTVCVQYVREELLKKAQEFNVPLKIEYINCKLKKIADTEYRIFAELIRKLGEEIPATGLPTDQVYSKFIELVDKEKVFLVIILDEIDQAVKKISDSFLYNLTRLNSELKNSQICIIGISNDISFLDYIDPRVKSSLSEEEIIFPPYNALQLQDILKIRAVNAFKENVLADGVIAKCSAYAAREHGDARRALDLLRLAGEIAERENSAVVTLEHIDKANERIERDKIIDIVSSEPKQYQLVLLSIIQLDENKGRERKIFTGDVYNIYQNLCVENGIETLTQRRVSDIIAEFDMLGLVNAKVVSNGRHGRTREIKLSIPSSILPKVKEILNEAIY